MVDNGAKIRTAPVGGWYDCGKTETLLETNHHLLETTRGGVDSGASLEGTEIEGAIRVEDDVVVRDSVLGPNVTLEQGARVEGSTLRHCIVGRGTAITGAHLHDSILGADCRIAGVRGILNAGPHTQLDVEG